MVSSPTSTSPGPGAAVDSPAAPTFEDGGNATERGPVGPDAGGVSRSVVLIDLSITFRRHWHATEHEEVSSALRMTVADVVRWAEGADGVAVCIDSPPYRRRELLPEYKAHRDKASETMVGQMRATIDRLKTDGFLVLGAPGYEADDIIASATARARESGCDVVIYSGDKDVLQLVGDGVAAVSTATGQRFDAETVEAKFGVGPDKIVDLLALCGDKSDNIPGVKGVGPKTAAKWLADYGDLEGIIEAASQEKLGSKSGSVDGAALVLAAQCIYLEDDAPIDISTIFEPRQAAPLVEVKEDDDMAGEIYEATFDAGSTTISNGNEAPAKEAALATTNGNGNGHNVPWERALEPTHTAGAMRLAQHLHNSRMFGSFPNPDAILAIIMTGRDLGLSAVAALRGFQVINGKPCPSAQLLIGQVKASRACEYFMLVESTDKSATFETKRVGEPKPVKMTYTIEEARQAGLTRDNWVKRPKTMLRWRCSVELARAVYPDITSGLYTDDEMLDVVSA